MASTPLDQSYKNTSHAHYSTAGVNCQDIIFYYIEVHLYIGMDTEKIMNFLLFYCKRALCVL